MIFKFKEALWLLWGLLGRMVEAEAASKQEEANLDEAGAAGVSTW